MMGERSRVPRNTYWLGLVILLLAAYIQTTEAATHDVMVGGNHAFEPETLRADVGDIIQFKFLPKNHSVVRSTMKYPCVPYELVEPGKGFFSGFRPVMTIQEDPPTWNIVVNDTDPVFFYCSAPGSCKEFGMVGIINPIDLTPIREFKSRAKNSSFTLQPGDEWPDEDDGASTTLSASSYPTTSSSSSHQTQIPTIIISSPTASDSSKDDGGKSGLSPGGIAGVAIGGAAVVAMFCLLFFVLGRRGYFHRSYPSDNHQPPHPPEKTAGGSGYGSPTSPLPLPPPPHPYPYHPHMGYGDHERYGGSMSPPPGFTVHEQMSRSLGTASSVTEDKTGSSAARLTDLRNQSRTPAEMAVERWPSEEREVTERSANEMREKPHSPPLVGLRDYRAHDGNVEDWRNAAR